MDPQKITELALLLRFNGDKILSSEFTLTLSGSLLRALNDSFTLIADSLEIGDVQNFQVVKPINSISPVFRDLQLVHDFVQKTALLCINHYPGEEYFEGKIDISKFRALKRLEVQKVNIKQIAGIQKLRGQLQHLICTKSIKCVDDIITHCGGDNSNGFVWNELKIADFSYNHLQTVDTSLEFAQYLQHLNLRHNQLQSVKAIRWLPHLKTLDLSFNRLLHVPQFHMDANKRLQSLNMSNNLVEDLMGIVKLDALTDLDLSDNCLLDHTYLLPLSALDTLKFLNLFGNPLHFHPKHRLATAPYLHKNCSTVKFILDFEPLSKNEKSLTGTQKLRQVGALNRYAMRSSTSISTTGRLTPSSNQTPASSVGSLVSFVLPDNTSESSETNAELISKPQKKKSSKVRCVEIEEHCVEYDENFDSMDASEDVMNTSIVSVTKTKSIVVAEEDKEHLEIKGQIVNLRKKYGNEWLQTGNAEMMSSVLGLDSSNTTAVDIDMERQKSRDMFNEYIKDLTEDSTNLSNSLNNTSMITSTPTNNTLDNTMANLVLTPIKPHNDTDESSLYHSLEQTKTLVNTFTDNDQTLYKSLDNNNTANKNPFEEDENECKEIEETRVEEEHDHLKNVYTSTETEEDELSEREDDEETYIVYTSNRNEAIFLTKSSNFLRERDPLTEVTKTKWSLKILESCDRIKSNTLRINFDTVKSDKQERVYIVEEDLCQELEKKLRDILSQRDLAEMNQTIYRCVNCSCQFSQENKYKLLNNEIRCPDCKSTFVAEIHDIPKSIEKAGLMDKLSPASIVEELPSSIVPLNVQHITSRSNSIEVAEETNSIGSANSLNDSSCSKITTNSQSESSFNSNQSLVGSSNTDRDLDFKTNGESDVDIISNPSQSSIEVLDHYGSRKTSEERRSIAQIPNLETIDDQSYTQTFLEREFDNMINYANKDKDLIPEDCPDPELQSTTALPPASDLTAKKSTTSIVQNNLTESSSSGSVTDSICTAYEQKSDIPLQANEGKKKAVKDFLQHEANSNAALAGTTKKDDNNGLTSMFGALMQSTNILMSSSKKIIDSETLSNVKSGTVIPSDNSSKNSNSQLYKFNYTDFNEIDHRLKLYFYQSKFEEKNEHFKWIVRGRIFNENTKTLTDGLVVVSTCKIYIMEAFAAENDDVTKWLRPITSCTVDRLETIQLLPWKMGLSFYLRDWGGFLLLLQDILRTDSLMLFFANNSLPSPCDLKYQPNELLLKRLNAAVIDEQLNMFSLLNGCEISCENAKRSFNICGLLTTDSRLYLSSEKLDWLSELNHDSDIELCVTQFMSNLVEVECCSDNTFIINFLDETQDKCELWKCTFETADNANTCLNSIAQSWEKLFGVPLINA